MYIRRRFHFDKLVRLRTDIILENQTSQGALSSLKCILILLMWYNDGKYAQRDSPLRVHSISMSSSNNGGKDFIAIKRNSHSDESADIIKKRHRLRLDSKENMYRL